MLFKSNILALVGGGSSPAFPLNQVQIWDEYLGRSVLDLSFKSPVRNVKLRKDRYYRSLIR